MEAYGKPNYDEFIIYDCLKKEYRYPMGTGNSDGKPFGEILRENELASEDTIVQIIQKIEELAVEQKPQVYSAEYLLGNEEHLTSWYRVSFANTIPKELVSITFADIDKEVALKNQLLKKTEFDELTGLMNRKKFCKEIEPIIQENKDAVTKGEYAFVYFDVIRFKAINDLFGMDKGDELLRYIANVLQKLIGAEDKVCRLNADRFAVFVKVSGEKLEKLVNDIIEHIGKYNLPFEIACNIGIYVTCEEQVPVNAMLDRAMLAQSTIKGSYVTKFNYYNQKMRDEMLTEQEVVGIMTTALAERQFVVYYQPQYDHSTGVLVGAEALVRWKHPEKGLISPGIFIPIFEKNGFITKLDLCVFEEVCLFLRKCLDNNLKVVPISSNFSRHDIFQPDFVSRLEGIRQKYDIPSKYLRVEITESAITGSGVQANEIVRKLHNCGYVVEMDDFGSGYSSLNVLKDIELDILKLDMLFLSKENQNNKGGTIISSVVRMAKWLDMPIIAEGVESVEQADFLRSIGCNYIQGYLYSKPLPEEMYEELLGASDIGEKVAQMQLLQDLDSNSFWNPKSQETLIFSNYVGGASIFEYQDGKVEVLRVNKRYLKEFSDCVSEKDIIENDPMRFFDEENTKIYTDMLDRAIETGEEQECETWRKMVTSCCDGEWLCIRTSVQVIGKSGDSYLFYAMVRNITTEKRQYMEMQNTIERFRILAEQADVYYWEYIIDTQTVYPCERCVTERGLPEIVYNYPENAPKLGIVPQEVAEAYRQFHEQLSSGIKEAEIVVPMTKKNLPHRVKYTVMFDEGGVPVKAYGCAVEIKNEK